MIEQIAPGETQDGNADFWKQAEIVALTSGANYDFIVKAGPAGSGSHWDPVHREYCYDSAIEEYPDRDAAFGVIQHEANHELVSSLDYVVDLWQEMGFSFGLNAVEDPRANQGGTKMLPGTKKWIQSYIEMDLSPGGGLDYKDIKKDARQDLGYVPKFMQAGAEMIRYWHDREFTGKIADPAQDPNKFQLDFDQFLDEIPDEDVRDFVKKAQPHFETYYHTIPSTKAEKNKYAKESSDNFRNNIWPDYKKLVEKSFKDHSMAKMIEDMMNQGQPQSGQGSGGQPMMIPFESLPKDVQDEIKKAIEDAQKEAGKQQQAGQGESQEGEGQQDEEQQGEGQESQGQPQVSESEQSGAPKSKVPWDKLSEKAKEEVEKVFDDESKVSEEQKKKYQEEAKKELEGAEDKANEKLQGDMVDKSKTPSHQEKREGEEREVQRKKEEEYQRDREQERQKEREEAQETIEDMQRRSDKAAESLRANPYFEFLEANDVKGIIQLWKNKFMPLFEPTVEPQKKYSATGIKASLKGGFKRAADKRYDKIFEVKGVPTMKSFRFSILVDLSGSMEGENLDQTMKTVVAMAEVWNAYGIEFEIAGFTDTFPGNIKVYKKFDDKKLTREIREKIGKMYYDGGGGTPTKEATLKAYKSLKDRIKRRPMENNYFITLTDGQCTSCSAAEMVTTVDKIVRERAAVTTGLGIGPGTEFVNKSYPMLPKVVRQKIASFLGKTFDETDNSFPDIFEFSQVFPKIIEFMIRQPQLFFRSYQT